MLAHSKVNFNELPPTMLGRHPRSRTTSRASPYVRAAIAAGVSPTSLSGHSRESSDASVTEVLPMFATRASVLQPVIVHTNMPSPAKSVRSTKSAKAKKALKPLKLVELLPENEKISAPRTRVNSNVRRSALGWVKRAPKSSADQKENTSAGPLMKSVSYLVVRDVLRTNLVSLQPERVTEDQSPASAWSAHAGSHHPRLIDRKKLRLAHRPGAVPYALCPSPLPMFARLHALPYTSRLIKFTMPNVLGGTRTLHDCASRPQLTDLFTPLHALSTLSRRYRCSARDCAASGGRFVFSIFITFTTLLHAVYVVSTIFAKYLDDLSEVDDVSMN
jgi:hypothetical protein